VKWFVSKAPCEELPLERVVPDPQQPRKVIVEQTIESFAASMERHGQMDDILVFREGDDFMIADGHCRTLGAHRLGWKTIRGRVCPERPSAKDLFTFQYIINQQRESLTPLEQLDAFKRFMLEFGLKQSEIAEWVGTSKSMVSTILRLEGLAETERALLVSGQLSLTAAAALCRMDAETRQAALGDLMQGKVTRDNLQERSRRKKSASGAASSLKRVMLELPEASASFAARDGMSLDLLLKVLDDLVRACKKARAQGLDISTMVRVLRDRANAERSATGGSRA
jgi:ParB family chromosome partitioning protein